MLGKSYIIVRHCRRFVILIDMNITNTVRRVFFLIAPRIGTASKNHTGIEFLRVTFRVYIRMRATRRRSNRIALYIYIRSTDVFVLYPPNRCGWGDNARTLITPITSAIPPASRKLAWKPRVVREPRKRSAAATAAGLQLPKPRASSLSAFPTY